MLLNSLSHTQNPNASSNLNLRPASLPGSNPSLPAGLRSLTFLPLPASSRSANTLILCAGFRKGVGRGRGGRTGGRGRTTTTDYERKSLVKWVDISKRISNMENLQQIGGVAALLNNIEGQGKTLVKWELCRVVRELRKFRRYKLALEVYEWMNNRAERFTVFSSDMAIQLDLIAKTRGISSAEEFFLSLPESLKDKRTYGALLHAYVGSSLRDKAELLMDQIKKRGYASDPLAFNVMMTLYMKLKEFEKVDLLISEMKHQNIRFDVYSYNIWLSARGTQATSDGMEDVFEQMKQDDAVKPNWTTYGSLATVYIRLGQLNKAEECLKGLESKIIGRNRKPYHYLLSLYGSVGNREELYRVWSIYKALFMRTTNWGYHAMVSSLVRVGDIEGAEKIYEEWVTVKSSFDARIGNLLLGWYVRQGQTQKVGPFFDRMCQDGEPHASTWEILTEGCIREGRASDAVACLRKAVASTEVSQQYWKPKPVTVSSILELCDKKGDEKSKMDMVGLLKQLGCFENDTYYSLLSDDIGSSSGEVMDDYGSDPADEGESGDDAPLLLSMAE